MCNVCSVITVHVFYYHMEMIFVFQWDKWNDGSKVLNALLDSPELGMGTIDWFSFTFMCSHHLDRDLEDHVLAPSNDTISPTDSTAG